MKRIFVTVIAAVMFAILPAVAGATPTAVPAPSPVAGSTEPENAQDAMSLADRPTKSPAVTAPIATVKLATLNVRKGPDTSYPVLTTARQNAALPVLGQFNKCAWLKVQSAAGEGWVAGAAKYVTLNVACATLPEAAAPARVIRTSVGSVTPVAVEMSRRFPSGCSANDWICYEANNGYLYLAVWFVPANGSPSSGMIEEFFAASEGVVAVASNGNRTESTGGGFIDDRAVVTFIVDAGDKDFKLCWPGNPCIYVGSGGTIQPANSSQSPAGLGANL